MKDSSCHVSLLRRLVLTFAARWCAGSALCLGAVHRLTRHWLPWIFLALAGLALVLAGYCIADAAAARCRARWRRVRPVQNTLFGVSSWLHTWYSGVVGQVYLFLPVLLVLPVVVFVLDFRALPTLAFTAGEIFLAFSANSLLRHIDHDPALLPPPDHSPDTDITSK